MVGVDPKVKGKAKADPRNDAPLEFKAEEHTSAKTVERHRKSRPSSADLITMYMRYQQDGNRGRRRDDEEAYYRRQRRYHEDERRYSSPRRHNYWDEHWDCPYFRYCWSQGMERLPTRRDCPECSNYRPARGRSSVFDRLAPPQSRRQDSVPYQCRGRSPPHHITPKKGSTSAQPQKKNTGSERRREECHNEQWCPGGMTKSQKRRVQRLRCLELAEEEYLRQLKKTAAHYQIPSLRPRQSNVWRRKTTTEETQPSAPLPSSNKVASTVVSEQPTSSSSSE